MTERTFSALVITMTLAALVLAIAAGVVGLLVHCPK